MAATVQVAECNGAGGATTSNVSNINFGSTEAANIVVATYPITVGTHSYYKNLKIQVTALGGSNQVDNIRIWKSAGAYLTDEGIKTNLTDSGYTSVSYAQGTQVSYSGNVMPTAEPGTANLGIAGALAGAFTATGSSDIWKIQLQTGAGTPAGNANQKTFTIKYDEQ